MLYFSRLFLLLSTLALSLIPANAFLWQSREHLSLDLNSPETLQLEADKKYSIGIRGLPEKSFQAYIKPASGVLKRELVVENLVKQVKSTTVDFNLKTSKYLSQNQIAGNLVLVVYLNYKGGNLAKESYSIPITISVN